MDNLEAENWVTCILVFILDTKECFISVKVSNKYTSYITDWLPR